MQTRLNIKNINPKNTTKSPIHENTNAKITCDFGDERFRIAAARLEKDIFVRTHLHTARIVVRMNVWTFFGLFHLSFSPSWPMGRSGLSASIDVKP